MKAARINGYGDESTIEVTDIAVPEPGADQIQVKVIAVGLNPFDNLVLVGHVPSVTKLLPATIGIDFAGLVTKLGTKTTGFTVGDRVFGTAGILSGASGALAEYATTGTRTVARTPDTISDQAAAALPTASLTALKTLRQFDPQPGQRIFINGGAGGVGSSAIQLAKAAGAYVITSAAPANSDYVKSLGADEIHDYHIANYLDAIRDCDFAFETVRRDNIDEVLAVLKKGGTALSIVGPFDQDLARHYAITAIENPHDLPGALEKLRDVVVDDQLHVHIGCEFTLDNVRQAYHALNHASVQGKIVVNIA